MPSIRVTIGAAISCLFVCALFGGEGVTQTVSAQPIGKSMQLPQPAPGKSETKTSERSAAKRASKAHPAAKKPASIQAASKDITNGAPQVTAPLSEPVTDDEAMRVASPEQANDIGLVPNAQGALGSDASPAATTVVNRTVAPAGESSFGAAALSQTPNSGIGGISWLLWIIAAVGTPWDPKSQDPQRSPRIGDRPGYGRAPANDSRPVRASARGLAGASASPSFMASRGPNRRHRSLRCRDVDPMGGRVVFRHRQGLGKQ